MSTHTPGPWEWARQAGFPDNISIQTQPFAGDIAGIANATTPRDEANARLIAAAPDLLAACEAAKAFLVGLGEPTTVLLETKLSAAIAKAKGGGS